MHVLHTLTCARRPHADHYCLNRSTTDETVLKKKEDEAMVGSAVAVRRDDNNDLGRRLGSAAAIVAGVARRLPLRRRFQDDPGCSEKTRVVQDRHDARR